MDIQDGNAIQDLFQKEKFDKVVHLAALAGVPMSTKFPQAYTRVNVDGTVNMLTASKDNGVQKFVFASTASVYGAKELKVVKETDSVMQANSVYGATKVAGEVLCYAYTNLYALNAVTVRIFGPIYGPLQRPKGMFMQRLINFIHNDKTLQIYGRQGLETAKDTTYIDDEVAGIVLALDKDINGYDVFNIGTSNPHPLKEWIHAVEDSYGKKAKIEIIEGDKADTTSSADITKARTILGYEPKIDIYEGAKRQVEVFKLMPEWYQSLDDV
ncbi:MAG: NAD-dependent epimerase/dehydratase family protein [Niabella sp.]|nr:MAG: NAD-dependent epimerase/dehydratase family protein [Niabella sp.]